MDAKTLDVIGKLVNRATSDNPTEAESSAKGALARLRKAGYGFEEYVAAADHDSVFQYGLVRVADRYVAGREDLSNPQKRELYAKLLRDISAKYSGSDREADSAREDELRKKEEDFRRKEREAERRREEKEEDLRRRERETAEREARSKREARGTAPSGGPAGREPGAPSGSGGEAHRGDGPTVQMRRKRSDGGRSGEPRNFPDPPPSFSPAGIFALPKCVAAWKEDPGRAFRAYAAGVLFGLFSGVAGTLLLAFAFAANGSVPSWASALSPVPAYEVVFAIGSVAAAIRVCGEFSPWGKRVFSTFP
jgi:hypothetical protein